MSQAYEYEEAVAAKNKLMNNTSSSSSSSSSSENGNKDGSKTRFLQQFFDSTQGIFTTATVKAWDVKLRELREEAIAKE